MSEKIEVTEAEMVFMARMLPHLLSGKSFEDAGRAVLADDERLFSALHDRRHSQYVPTADERGHSYDGRIGKGDVIVSELCRTVYERLRAA